MTANVQAGSVLMDDRPEIRQALGLAGESYSGSWNLVKGFDGFSLDKKIHAAGWNFLFIAAEVKGMVFGGISARNLQRALQQIVEKVKHHNFNCLEVTGIRAKHFLGVPYVTVSVHSRHIQRSCSLDTPQDRQRIQNDAEWARG